MATRMAGQMIEPRPAKRDGRTTQTRAHILREAERLYYRGGYAGVNLQEIADTLGLTKAALFHHFRSKQDLFCAMLLEMLRQRQEPLEAAIGAASGTAERLRAIMRVMAAFPFFDPMKFQADEHGKLSPEQQRAVEQAFATCIQQPIARALAEGVERGELRPHRPMLGVMYFLTLVMMLPSPGHPNLRLASGADLDTHIDELLAFFLHGLASE
jgi:AcrR family transcriptional regulator